MSHLIVLCLLCPEVYLKLLRRIQRTLLIAGPLLPSRPHHLARIYPDTRFRESISRHIPLSRLPNGQSPLRSKTFVPYICNGLLTPVAGAAEVPLPIPFLILRHTPHNHPRHIPHIHESPAPAQTRWDLPSRQVLPYRTHRLIDLGRVLGQHEWWAADIHRVDRRHLQGQRRRILPEGPEGPFGGGLARAVDVSAGCLGAQAGDLGFGDSVPVRFCVLVRRGLGADDGANGSDQHEGLQRPTAVGERRVRMEVVPSTAVRMTGSGYVKDWLTGLAMCATA